MLAAVELRRMGVAASRREADRNIVQAIDAVAARLGNTRAVCRKYYIHPVLLDAYMMGETVPTPPPARGGTRRTHPGAALRRDEVVRARISGTENAMNLCKVALSQDCLAAAPAWAQTIDRIQSLAQQEFACSPRTSAVHSAITRRPDRAARDHPASMSLRADRRAAAQHQRARTGELGQRAWHAAIPTLRAQQGPAAGFDVGVMYASIPSSNIRYYGGELRYAIIEGDAVAPAIGVRGSLTKLSGVDQLSLDHARHRSVDLQGLRLPHALCRNRQGLGQQRSQRHRVLAWREVHAQQGLRRRRHQVPGDERQPRRPTRPATSPRTASRPASGSDRAKAG